MYRIPRLLLAAAVAAVPAFVNPTPLPAAEAPAAVATQDPAAKAQAAIDKGLAFLKAKQQPSGAWQTQRELPGLTALVLETFVRSGKYDAKTDFVKKGYDNLIGYQVASGGIYKDALATYNTALAVSALAAANDPAYKERLDRAADYLKKLQWGPNMEAAAGTPPADAKNPWYGGWGYGAPGPRSRPDLSNVHFAVEALKDAGLKADDPAFKAAVTFLGRTQNRSESNDLKFAGDDGGFVYALGADGQGSSAAGEYIGPDGRTLVRSYGSMTYAGLKSMIHAGLTKDDARVKAAWDWIRKNWTLDENPGMRLGKPDEAQNGLYYYYALFGKALNVYDEPVVTDAKGTKHDWRAELIDKVAALQKPDGSWQGEAKWMEGDPIIVTAYSLLALEAAAQNLDRHPPAK